MRMLAAGQPYKRDLQMQMELMRNTVSHDRCNASLSEKVAGWVYTTVDM